MARVEDIVISTFIEPVSANLADFSFEQFPRSNLVEDFEKETAKKEVGWDHSLL